MGNYNFNTTDKKLVEEFTKARKDFDSINASQYFPTSDEVNYKVFFNFYDKNDGALEKPEVKRIMREFLTIIKQQIEMEEKRNKELQSKSKEANTELGKAMKDILNNKKVVNGLIELGNFDRMKDNEPSIFVDILFGFENDLSFDAFVSFFEDIMKIPNEKRSIKVPLFQ